jgi:predicted nucleic acid-binding protein
VTSGRYLADTSAVVRILRKQAPAGWDDLIERGQVCICQAVEIEVLRASGGREAYREWKRVLFATFPLVTEPEDVLDRARVLQATLATTSQHQGPGAIDLVIALTAARHGLSVLHDDRDFTTIAQHGDIGLLQHNVSNGPPTP